MAIVTGFVADFSDSSLPTGSRLRFTPSGPGIRGDYIHAPKPTIVNINPDGSFTAALTPTDTMRPATHYLLSIEWPDSDLYGVNGGYISMSRPPWVITVPGTGGAIGGLLAAPWNPTLAWYGPSEPGGIAVPNTLWLDTDTPMNDLLIWSN
jgi:hypothetical protein